MEGAHPFAAHYNSCVRSLFIFSNIARPKAFSFQEEEEEKQNVFNERPQTSID
jgi:hypothetical protein